MRKTELLSGRVKKVTGTSLDSTRYEFLDLKNAEPDLGFPTSTNSLAASTSTGTRSWLSTNSALSGLSVNAGALIVNEDTVAVDTSGFVNTTANNLHQVLTDLDQNLGSTTASALTAVVTDNTIDGNGTVNNDLTIGQGVRPTDDPYFQGLQVAPQDAVSAIALNNPLRVTTTTTHDLTDGDLVTFRDVEGTTQINGVDYYVEVVDTTNVDLYSDQALTTAIDGTGGGYSSFTSGGFLIGGGYRFPSLDGTSTHYLKTDGLGQLSFHRPVQYSATAPTSPDVGDMWFDYNSLNDLLMWNGTAWQSTTSGGVQSAFTLRQFAGDGTTTVFNTNAPGVQKVLVFLNGVLLRLTDDFTYNSSTGEITFLATPASSDTIEVLLTGDADLVGLELLGIANHDLITVDSSGNVTLQGELDMDSNKIVNVIDPTAAQDAATKNYVDTVGSAVTLNTSGDTGTGSIISSTQVLAINGTANEIETVAANQAITVGLPSDVTIGNDLTITNDLIGPNLFSLNPTTISASTVNYTVTVSTGTQYGGGSGDVYFLENTTAGTSSTANPVIQLYRGNTYVFDVSDNTNTGHPLRFSADGGTTEYTTGVTSSGTPGQAGATVTFVVATTAPISLNYYCTVHGAGMGNLTNQVNLGGTIIIAGDLQVDGTQTIINSTELVVDDKTITVADGSINKGAAANSGLQVDLGSDGNATLFYNSDKWVFNNVPYYNALRILTTDDLTGSDNYAYKTVQVIDTDAAFSWSETGTIVAPSNTGTLKFVSGGAIDLDVDTTGYAIRVQHTDTSTVADFTASNNTNQFLASLAMTFDTYGHVQTVSPTYSNVAFNNDFGTLTVSDTDSGYTWAATGNVGAGQTSDTATYISGDAIDIDVDATSKAIRWTNTDKGSSQLIIGNIVVQNTTTGFSMSETGTFSANTNTDTITLIPLTGMDIDIDTTNGAFTFENTDTGSAQDIIKSIEVVDSSSGFSFGETGTWAVSGNTDLLTVVQGDGIDLDIDTTNGAIRITNDDRGSVQNIFNTVAVTDNAGAFTWSETGNVVAESNTDTITLVSGAGMDLDADTTNDGVLFTNTDRGSVQNIIKTLEVSDTDSGYTWAATGSIAASTNSDTVKFVSGTDIEVDVDATSKAIKIEHVAGWTFTDPFAGTPWAKNYFVAAINIDNGHTTGYSTVEVDFDVSDNYAFKTVIAGGTNLVAESNTDTLTISAAQLDSTTGIVITGTAGTDTLTIAHANTSSVSNVTNTSNTFISGATFDTYGHLLTHSSGSVDFAVADNYAFKTITVSGQSDIIADNNVDSLALGVTGTGFSINTNAASDTITFENTDKGSSQLIFKTLAVTDTNSGYSWAQIGSFAAANNTDTFTFVSGTGINLDIDLSSGAMLVENTDRGSAQSIFKSFSVADIDSGYSWSASGTANVTSNTDSFNFISGTGIDIDIDTSSKAIRVTNTSQNTDPGSAQDIIKSIIVTDTNSGFSWSETGVYSVSGNNDALTFVSGQGIDIDVDTSTGAIKIENPTSGVAFTESTFTGTGSQDTFSLGTGFTTASIYVNGVLVDDGTDYTFTPATGSLVFTMPPSNGDLITAHKYTQTMAAVTLTSLGLTNHDDVTVDSSGNVVITGNLTVQGTQTSSSTQTLTDPIITLGGSTPPSADDNLDRGIVFRWHDGTNAKIGFFGFDDSDSDFTFIPDSDGTNAYEPAGGGTDLADYGGAKFKHVIGRNVRVGYTNGNTIDTSSGNLTINSTGGTTNITDNTSITGTLGVSSTATFGGTVEANNGITVDSTKFIVENGTGNVTTAGTLNVTGLASLDGGIDMDGVFTVANTTGHTVTTGNLTVGGNTVLNGNVDIGNAATDTVTFNADIDSHLIPNQDVTYDLGATGAAWRDLYLSGNTIYLGGATITESNGDITIGSVEGTPIGATTPSTGAFTTLSATSTLDVGGDTGIDGDFDIATDKFTVASATGNTLIAGTLSAAGTTVSTLKVSDLTTNRIVTVGATGEIADASTLTFNGTTFTVGSSFSVTQSSGAVSAGEITSSGGKFGNVKVGQTGNNEIDTSSGNLTIDSAGGTTTIDDILSVSGAATMSSTLGVTSNITAGGTVSMAGGSTTANFNFTDGNKAVFGTGSDLQIYHTGGTSVINDVGTGRLFIGGSPGVDIGAPEIDEYYIRAYNDGAVELYYDNAKKLETTATGIDVTGIITTDGMNTSANVNFGDDNKAIFGASNDLEIFHQSSNGNSIIKESGGGSLSIQGNGTYINLWDHASSQHMLIANIGGAVELYHNGSKKLATTSTGIDVTGTASITGDGADVIVNSVDHELVLLGNRGASGVNLDKGYLRMKSESTNTVVLDTAGDSYLNGGDVGIGTASPSAKLHMYTGSVGANTGVTDMLRLELNRSDHSTTPSGPAILFKDQDTNNSTNEARIKMMTVNDTDFGDNDESASNLIFETTNGGSASDKMIITGRGDIGIGTINPTAKLDVEGNIRLQSVNRDYVTSTLTTTSETAVATLSSTTYRSAKFMIQVTRGSEYQVTEALMIHDGTDAFVTVYGTMFTGSTALATFDADISGGSMRLLATSATTASTVYKISLTAIDT
jgi:hypothetical protein